MFFFQDELCEQYGITDRHLDYGMDNALHFQEEHTHLFNAASHLFFEWCDSPSEKNYYATKEMIEKIRELMIQGTKSKALLKKLQNDKIWYSALLASEDLG